MALATRCPACNTVFRISTAQAAAKGGMVRCGQCSNVFNSLDALVRVEDLEVIEEVDVAHEVAADPATDVAMDNEVEPSVTPHGPDDRADDTVLAMHALLDGDHVPDDPPTRAIISEWWLPDPNATTSPTGPGTTTGANPERSMSIASRAEAAQGPTGRRTDAGPVAGMGIGGPAAIYGEPEPATGERRNLVRWALGLASFVAVLALIGQAAYHWRDEIAARWPAARPALTAACAPLRCKVGYPLHGEAVTIESTSVQTGGPNTNVYTLTALLRNRDAVDVRYPHLALVLTDLQDRPILRRALRPEDYLPPGRATPSPAFPAESELPIRVVFELNDLRFAGYRLEKFYP